MKICYFGIYNPDQGRNRVYIKGLKENEVEIIHCRDNSQGLLKFIKLFLKHWEIRNVYDYLIVGYPGHIMVPFAKMISRKKVVFDALCSLYEGEIISRGSTDTSFLKKIKIWLIDFFAYLFADCVLVETNVQADFISKKFFVKKGKCVRIFTGADDSEFFIDKNVIKKDKFTVIFRGQFLPEAGVDTILQSAKILEKENINFLIYGGGFLKNEIQKLANDLDLKNLTIINKFLTFEEMRSVMLSCHINLGQFGLNERLERTIPHKAFEAMAISMPYITGRSGGILELLKDRMDCLMVNLADPIDLSDKILELKNNPELATKIANSGYKLYSEKLTPKKLAGEILKFIKKTFLF